MPAGAGNFFWVWRSPSEPGAHFSFRGARGDGVAILPLPNARGADRFHSLGPVTVVGRSLAFDASNLGHIAMQWSKDKSLRRSTQMIPSLVPRPGALF